MSDISERVKKIVVEHLGVEADFRPARKAHPALVEENEPREGRKPLEEPSNVRLLPEEVNIRDPAGDDHQVTGSIAYDLVGDIDVPALRVAGLRPHGESLFHRSGPRQE